MFLAPADTIPEQYKGTPIGDLMEYHNFGRPFDVYPDAKVLIGMCMDNRKQLRIPDQFAFVLRAGGANLQQTEFKVSYVIALRGIKHVALIAHTECRMVNLLSRKDDFIKGMMENAAWTKERATEYFDKYAPLFDITNETEFVFNESKRFKEKYPGIEVSPFLYKMDDGKLYPIME